MRLSPIRHLSMALMCAGALLVGASAAACNRGGTSPQAGQAAAGGGNPSQPQDARQAQNAQPSPAMQPAQDPQQPQNAPLPQDGRQPQSVALSPNVPNPPPDAPGGTGATGATGAAGAATDRQAYLDDRHLPLSAGSTGAAGSAGSGDRRVGGVGGGSGGGAGAPLVSDAAARTGAVEPVLLPRGTRLTVEMEETLSSSSSRVGERFRARVIAPVYERGVLVIPSGSEAVGVVTQAAGTGRIGGRARLAVRFTELLLPSGSSVPIRASFAEVGRSKTGRDAAIIGGSAAGGGIIGHNVNRGNRDKGTVIGALVGAAVGTAIAANTPGRPLVIPKGATLRLRLRRALEVPVRR
jgi:hypothetical protein